MAQTWLEKYSTYEDEVTEALTGITAYAGGGQANATALTVKFNNVTVVGTNADSVKLPAALVGKSVYVQNSDSTQYLTVYPQSGEYMNGVVNAGKAVTAGFGCLFVCIYDGYWQSYHSA